MLLVFVLFFCVACSALPTSEDGENCLYGCYVSIAIPGGAATCKSLSKFMTCWKPCPSSRQDAVVKQVTGLYQKLCSSNVTKEQREQFAHSHEELDKRLTDRASRCEDRAPKDDEALCKNLASCVLGSALDELKIGYSADLVTAVVDWRKLWSIYNLKDHKSPPEACSFLYEPFKV